MFRGIADVRVNANRLRAEACAQEAIERHFGDAP
jgi:hypothetical protein